MNVPPAPLALALALGSLALLLARPTLAAIAIEFEGIEGEIEAAARGGLELQQYAEREVSAHQVNRLVALAPEQIRTALEPYGYYRAVVVPHVERGAAPQEYKVRFRVELGPPVTVNSVNVTVGDAAAEVPVVEEAVANFRPVEGERLEHGVYEGSKSNISTALQAAGFFKATLERHRIEVNAGAASATVDLAWNAGERFRFGPVTFTDAQFPDTFLARYLPWKDGDFYSAEQLLALQQRLIDADYFESVAVQPLVDQARDGRVPIETMLTPAKRTIYRAGAYVSTDAGPGVRVGMERRWLNKRGHKVGGDIEYSQRLQEYTTFYRIPRPGERNRNYSFALGYRDEETDTSTSRMARLAASEVLDRWHGYTRTLGLQYLNGNFEIADERRDTNLLFAEAQLTRKRANDLMFPTRGLSVTYGLRVAAESLLSDTSMAQLRAEARWIRPAGDRSRLILRAAAGGMVVDEFDALPPELRFFAGGDRSVRGFDYQQIGETNATGGVIGGEFLAVASAEYEYFFLPKWGAAVFVDAGDAFKSNFDANVGAGIGVRWKSPVGLVRLDLAYPVATQLDESLRVHVLIGPDL